MHSLNRVWFSNFFKLSSGQCGAYSRHWYIHQCCYWRTLKANGELNAKYPNGIEAQKEKLEAEGHTIIQKGRKNVRYYVKDYENSLFVLKGGVKQLLDETVT